MRRFCEAGPRFRRKSHARAEKGGLLQQRQAVVRSRRAHRDGAVFMNGTGEAGMMPRRDEERSEEHTSELQSLMRISYAVFCLKKKKKITQDKRTRNTSHKYAH